MALWSLTDRGSAVLSPITWCGRERKRQFGSSLNFQKSWWSCENWTNCSNATLILCYSKCKLVSQKIFLITLRRVNLVCGDSLRSPLRITLSHEPRWLVWSALDTGPPPRSGLGAFLLTDPPNYGSLSCIANATKVCVFTTQFKG